MGRLAKVGKNTMCNCIVPIKFPITVKRELDTLKFQGYIIAGFVRKTVADRRHAQKGRTPHVD